MAAPLSGASSATPAIQIPKLVTSPIMALRPWPVDIDVGNTTVSFPAVPAADWLAILMRSDAVADDILELLPDVMKDDLFAALADNEVSYEELDGLCQDVVSLVSARPWHVAMKLIMLAEEAWDHLSGELIRRHVDAGGLSLAAWLDGIFHIVLDMMKPEQITMFLLKLEQPPAGTDVPEEDMQTSRNQFLGMMADG